MKVDFNADEFVLFWKSIVTARFGQFNYVIEVRILIMLTNLQVVNLILHNVQVDVGIHELWSINTELLVFDNGLLYNFGVAVEVIHVESFEVVIE